MQQADFIHLVRMSELDAQEQPARYRQHVIWFAALGYAYVGLSLIVGLALIVLGVGMFRSFSSYLSALCVLSGATIAWISLKALRLPRAQAEGLQITAKDAPELYKILGKLKSRLKAPAIDRVIITDDYNAYITQQPRFGIVGKPFNTLAIGLPLAGAISAQRLVAVLGHEYAHLRGGDGQFSAWIYRTRLAWSRLADEVQAHGTGNLFLALTAMFITWYAPRFTAKTFAAARQEEYRADALSARIAGANHMTDALIEIALLAPHMSSGFWRQYWVQAQSHAQPPALPYAWLIAGRLKPPAPHDVQSSYHQIKSEKTSAFDTHPSTKDRIEALKGQLVVPMPSLTSATGLLGAAAHQAAQQFDGAWWVGQKRAWARVHTRAQQDLAQIADMQSKLRYLQTHQLERLAVLVQRAQPGSDTRSIHHHLLQKDDTNVHALWQLGTFYAERGDMAALPHLDKLMATHSHCGYGACSVALELLDRQNYDDALGELRRGYSAAREKFDALEEAVALELDEAGPFDHTAPHGLTADELSDLQHSASLLPEIKSLWLLRRNLKTFPWRKRYVVVLAVNPAHAKNRPDIQALVYRLELPGRALGLDERWLADIARTKKPPALGQPLYVLAR